MVLDIAILFTLLGCAVTLEGGDDCFVQQVECNRAIISAVNTVPQDDDRYLIKICSSYRSAARCFTRLQEDCAENEEERMQMTQSKEEMYDSINRNCLVKDYKKDTCLKENEDYLNECMRKNRGRQHESVASTPNKDKNEVKCSAFLKTAECIFKRTKDKCGKKAELQKIFEFRNPPQDVQEACAAYITTAFFDRPDSNTYTISPKNKGHCLEGLGLAAILAVSRVILEFFPKL